MNSHITQCKNIVTEQLILLLEFGIYMSLHNACDFFLLF